MYKNNCNKNMHTKHSGNISEYEWNRMLVNLPQFSCTHTHSCSDITNCTSHGQCRRLYMLEAGSVYAVKRTRTETYPMTHFYWKYVCACLCERESECVCTFVRQIWTTLTILIDTDFILRTRWTQIVVCSKKSRQSRLSQQTQTQTQIHITYRRINSRMKWKYILHEEKLKYKHQETFVSEIQHLCCECMLNRNDISFGVEYEQFAVLIKRSFLL